MVSEPFYDPARSYQDNFDDGPFGLFAEPSTFRQSGEPQHSFLGHPVYAPFGIPAGPLLNGNFVKAALDAGFDIPTYKTVRTHRYLCHPWPNVLAVEVEGDLRPGRTLRANESYAEPLSITNSFGVPSFAPEFWQPDMAAAAAHAGPGQIVVGSFQGTLPEGGGMAAYLVDFALGARLVKETGVKIIEVNLSCPNEGTANLLCFDIGARLQGGGGDQVRDRQYTAGHQDCVLPGRCAAEGVSARGRAAGAGDLRNQYRNG
jgi:dihydroorotate dehydrogenase (NAD+) catalytic subunit